MSKNQPVFVPNGESREDTATLLVGTAHEYGIDQSEIKAVQGGFYISEALSEWVYGDEPEAGEPEADEPDTKATSKSTNKPKN